MKPRPHFLCTFRKRTDAQGRTYFSGTLGNSRLLLYLTAEGDLTFYLGGQVEPENKSREDDFRGANSKGPVSLDGMK